MRVGDQISQYTIVEHIGRGGMADVWSARDERLLRTVAIKTIVANLADDRAQTQFAHEARTIAGLEHPNILPVYDYGDFERQLYIVMRYVSGGSLLDRIIDRGWLPDEETLRIGDAVAAALERAHAAHVVHRDLKPANVLLDQFGTPYLADFGLASVIGSGEEDPISSGTLMYMPPEQMFGQAVDHRADIYAFGIVIFQMVTGEFPQEGETGPVPGTDPEWRGAHRSAPLPARPAGAHRHRATHRHGDRCLGPLRQRPAADGRGQGGLARPHDHGRDEPTGRYSARPRSRSPTAPKPRPRSART